MTKSFAPNMEVIDLRALVSIVSLSVVCDVVTHVCPISTVVKRNGPWKSSMDALRYADIIL